MTIYNCWIDPAGRIIVADHKGQIAIIEQILKKFDKKYQDIKSVEERNKFAIDAGYVLVEEDHNKKEIIFSHSYKEWNIPAEVSNTMKKIVFRHRKELELATK